MKSGLPAILRYEQAKSALAECHRVDEVKSIHDKAVAMQVYAKQAKDPEMIDLATEIRKRAEIRAGALLIEMKWRGERAKQGGTGAGPGKQKSQEATSVPTLVDLGVTKTQSSRWQKTAALPPEEQEEVIAKAKAKAQAAIDPPPKDKAKKQSSAPRLTSPTDDCIATVVRLVSECAHKISVEDVDSLFNELSLRLGHLHTTLRKTDGHYSERKSA